MAAYNYTMPRSVDTNNPVVKNTLLWLYQLSPACKQLLDNNPYVIEKYQEDSFRSNYPLRIVPTGHTLSLDGTPTDILDFHGKAVFIDGWEWSRSNPVIMVIGYDTDFDTTIIEYIRKDYPRSESLIQDDSYTY